MPIDMTVPRTMSEHARINAVANGITDVQIAERLRRKGYKQPERAVAKYVRGEKDCCMPHKVELSIWELIEEQDAALAAGTN